MILNNGYVDVSCLKLNFIFLLTSSSINPPIPHKKEVRSNLLYLLAAHCREVNKVSIATLLTSRQ